MLITDTSTIAMEFALAFKKPIIYFNYEKKIHNKEYNALNIEPLEEIFRNRFGINVQTIKELDAKLDHISNLPVNENFVQELTKFEKEYLYNHVNAISLATKYLNKH